MSRIENQLAALGLTLPGAKPPVANYLGTKRSGDLLFVSGRVSPERGELGSSLGVLEGKLAARNALLDILGIVKQDLGNLDSIVSVESLRGFVRSSPSFTEQPAVVDGASDLLVTLLGKNGRHARTATGASQLPYGAAVQLDLVLRLRSLPGTSPSPVP